MYFRTCGKKNVILIYNQRLSRTSSILRQSVSRSVGGYKMDEWMVGWMVKELKTKRVWVCLTISIPSSYSYLCWHLYYLLNTFFLSGDGTRDDSRTIMSSLIRHLWNIKWSYRIIIAMIVARSHTRLKINTYKINKTIQAKVEIWFTRMAMIMIRSFLLHGDHPTVSASNLI